MQYVIKGIFLTIFLFAACSAFAQKNEIDSLRFALYKTSDMDSARVDILNRLAWLSLSRNLDDQKIYCRQALLISRKLDYKRGEAEAFRMTGLGKLTDQAIPEALTYFQRSTALFHELNDYRGECNARINIAEYYYVQGMTAVSLKFLQNALVLAELNHYLRGIEEALQEAGKVELRNKNLGLARQHLDSALLLASKQNDIEAMIPDYEYLGDVSVAEKRPDLANASYARAMSMSSRSENVHKQIVLFAKMGESLEQSGNYRAAHSAFNSCIKLSRKYASSDLVAKGYLHMARLDSAQSNYHEALDHYRNYIRLKDSLELAGNNRQTLLMQARFDDERKQKENRQLVAQAEKDRDVIREQYVGLFLLLGMILLLIFNARKLNRLNVIKAKSLAELETKNKEISQQTQIIIEQKAEQEKMNRVKDKLFSVISHDMRAPLSQLKGIFNLMEMKALDSDEWQERVPELKKNVIHSSEQLDNLLVWSKNQMLGFNPVFVTFAVYNLVEKSRYLLDSASTRKNITVRNLIDPHLLVSADKEMTQIVIRNLLSNALKFTPLGGFIEISASPTGDCCIITVHDTGIGVKPRDAERIFNELDYTTNGTANEKGTGLGLKLAKDFVQMNNGKLWVEPSESIGSKFRFSLMLAATSAV